MWQGFFHSGEHSNITLRDAIIDEYKLAYENLKVENKESYSYKVLRHYDRGFCACDKHLVEVARMRKQRNIFAHEFRVGKSINIDAAWASLLRVADANRISLEFYTDWANHIDSLCDNDLGLASRYNIPDKNDDVLGNGLVSATFSDALPVRCTYRCTYYVHWHY